MRILIAHSFYRIPGGEDGYVRRQVELLSRWHDVELIAEQNSQLRPGLGAMTTMAFSASKADEIRTMIRRFAPDLVHIHNTYPSIGPAVHLAATSLKRPLVMTIHNFRLRCPNGYMFTEGELCGRCLSGAYVNAVLHRCFPTKRQAAAYASILWAHRFLMKLEKKIRMFVAPSGFMRDRLVEWGISPGRVTTVPNFVESRPEASSRPGPYGIYVGRLSSEKGIDFLLKSLSSAGDPPFRIVGDGPLRADLQKYAEDLGLRNTEFTGRLERAELNPMLGSARFVVMPSLSHEICPLAALEAMAAGRALLVTRRGGLPELVASGAGLVCEAGDVADMTAKLRVLFENERLCSKAGQVGLAEVRDRFSPERHHDRLMSVYSSTLGSPEAAEQEK